MLNAITSTKLKQTGELFWDSQCCLTAWVSTFLSPAHECEMKDYLVYLLIVKYLSDRFSFNSATIYQTGQPCRELF